ncbi:hypothetical protein [Ethanoligenens harbinense]|uniref:hypothetical protein n=1 Tax=Ethanoligenens harbinense TaxID=253239 RepID=UPI0010C04183|nr:hypothetical protein [Ethanoligenens harbinense]
MSYPNLRAAVAVKGLKYKRIADELSISAKALSNKVSGKTPFTWNEVCKIQKNFFQKLILHADAVELAIDQGTPNQALNISLTVPTTAHFPISPKDFNRYRRMPTQPLTITIFIVSIAIRATLICPL